MFVLHYYNSSVLDEITWALLLCLESQERSWLDLGQAVSTSFTEHNLAALKGFAVLTREEVLAA